MALYFPPLFCGKGTKLRSLKNFEVGFEDEENLNVLAADQLVVDEIIGYGFNIRKDFSKKIFRIMNSNMSEYFDIIEKVEPEIDLKVVEKRNKKGKMICLAKNFEIKNVIKFPKGREFLHIEETKTLKKFHELFSKDGKNIILRMTGKEFEEYFM
ncbi:hypothetical protein [Zunongwangia pacifica]|uniref:Uncharacterized protein n=1 Tax=Zunongwangia pacifica TaxID=2911062 RepID=A0A9X1ZR34_9FLAO|nr:hypothetical protein [Zunongwangia pacifica]MCL6219442.1 hypothetical protein [Zunongwangia pacifica]